MTQPDRPTYQQLADKFGVCRRAIEKAEQRALRKLRLEIERQAEAEKVTVYEWLGLE